MSETNVMMHICLRCLYGRGEIPCMVYHVHRNEDSGSSEIFDPVDLHDVDHQ